MRDLEDIAATVGREAATLVAEASGHARALGLKSSPTDVVTETDLRAEDLLKRRLLEFTPDAGIVGEEGGTTAPGARMQWVLDPLDGTVNFLYGVPLSAVSVAVAVDGEVVAGAVVDVQRHEVFSASLGGGARLDGAPIAASKCSSFATALVLTGFSYHADRRAEQGELVRRVLPRARDVRLFGSTALELCWVACGRADAYFQHETAIWDRAAGALIAAEAGAATELPCPENADLVISAAPAVFGELWDLVQLPER
ncbi:inositol monophosphatase family protein [Solirubrobacter soli]|uniref:inositol monophosphatase family protein n=1 Tax=Solirubrobacter soli TaxID=363832 RepID=UPI000415D150|nr:inositol monophosphatase family protein [Solirubrobacter soli]